MARSFGIVEDKLREAEFFLNKLCESSRISFDGRYYFSAFIAATRTVTLSMQSCLDGVPGFDTWYANIRERLKSDHLARFFHQTRNESAHVGINPYNQTPIEHLQQHLERQIESHDHSHILVVPSKDNPEKAEIVAASEACRQYFITLTSIVFECYATFKMQVDARWYYTDENFRSAGKTLMDAVVEKGFPPVWASYMPNDAEGWRVLRSDEPHCLINDIFTKYLNCRIDDPDSSSPSQE